MLPIIYIAFWGGVGCSVVVGCVRTPYITYIYIQAKCLLLNRHGKRYAYSASINVKMKMLFTILTYGRPPPFFSINPHLRFRPTLVALMYRALGGVKGFEHNETIFENQAALGAATEIIHVASLLHDDVLDEAETRRGDPATHRTHGNKVGCCIRVFL